MEGKVDGNYIKMVQAILDKSCRQRHAFRCCTATYHSSRKLSKVDETDMRDTAGEVGMTHKWCTPVDPFTWTSQDHQLEPTYISSMPIRDANLKTCRKQFTIGRGGKRGSKISVLMALRDDNGELFFLQKILTHTILSIPYNGNNWHKVFLSNS